MADVSAPVWRSMAAARPAANSSMAIHTLAQSTSTVTIWENSLSPTSKTSFMAV